jgi:hypothetical protein
VIMMRFCYARYCTLLEVQDYWQNKEAGGSENGRGVRVALCTHPTYAILMVHIMCIVREVQSENFDLHE